MHRTRSKHAWIRLDAVVCFATLHMCQGIIIDMLNAAHADSLAFGSTSRRRSISHGPLYL